MSPGNTDPIDIGLRMAAALDYVAAGNDKDIRTHYLWLVKQMMAHMTPEDLSTSELVATIVAWTPAHSRTLLGGKPADGDTATVLHLIPGGDAAAPAG